MGESDKSQGARSAQARDLNHSQLVQGDGNIVIMVPPGLTPEQLEEVLAACRRGQVPPEVAPLPRLRLRLQWLEGSTNGWLVESFDALRQVGGAGELATAREVSAPWVAWPGFAAALAVFQAHSRQPPVDEAELRVLVSSAQRLGDALAEVLSPQERQFLVDDGLSGDPPLLVIESDDDRILGLPWELLRLAGRYAVEDGRLDLARCVVGGAAVQELGPPTASLRLLVNVSAPAGTGSISYEHESLLITRVLHGQVGLVINEMGELADLVQGLAGDRPPQGVHFVGHGAPGSLFFEDAYGDAHKVPVAELLKEIRTKPASLPQLFFLANCHGGDAAAGMSDGLSATASVLQREGISQVVGYFGPVYDTLAVKVSAAFYEGLARGKRTREAVRAARRALSQPLSDGDRVLLRGLEDGLSAAGAVVPFGWAQLVLYQRGPDYPLGLSATGEAQGVQLTTWLAQRQVETAVPGGRTRILKEGFIGRRAELHALRRRMRDGEAVHLVQGLGGLGKSSFCYEALKVYARQDYEPVALWCWEVEQDADPVAGLLLQLGQVNPQWLAASSGVEERYRTHAQIPTAAQRFCATVSAYLRDRGRPLALYLDNLESLQAGPELGTGEIGAWRTEDCAALWNGLVALAKEQPSRFALLASSRYLPPETRKRQRLSFGRLGEDAVLRLLTWYPTLRRLQEENRLRLASDLAGHPRAVEFLEALLEAAVERFEDEQGSLEQARAQAGAGATASAFEWEQLVAPALPALTGELSENLLFQQLWQRVLSPVARELLVAATVLRKPVTRSVLEALLDPEVVGGAACRQAITELNRASLLTMVQVRADGGAVGERYEVHPTVAQLVHEQAESLSELLQEAHRRIGRYWAEQGEEGLEAVYHLDVIGDVDAAYGVLESLVAHRLDRYRFFEALYALDHLTRREGLSDELAAKYRMQYGRACQGAGKSTAALYDFEFSLDILLRLSAQDPQNAEWQRDLSVSYGNIGSVQQAQGNLGAALQSFERGLSIRERLAEQDPQNAAWQRELAGSIRVLGGIRKALGEVEVARECWSTALGVLDSLVLRAPEYFEACNDLEAVRALLAAEEDE